MRWFRANTVVLLVVVLLATTLAAPRSADAVAPKNEVETTASPGADPDTAAVTINGKPKYVTVTTTADFGPACENGFAWLPYYVHGNANQLGLDGACPTGDLLANVSGGKWIDVNWVGQEANRQRGLWAPSIFFHDDEYYLHYSGVTISTGQRCIWAVHAPSLAELKSAPRRLFACPNDTADIAIDADMFAHQGRLYVTYRDDGGSLTPEQSAIYVTEVNRHGVPIGTRHRLLHSADLSWTHYPVWPGVADQVVENPSLVFNQATKQWLLFFSGNGFRFASYATGVATCGKEILKGPKCKPLAGADRAYFGHGATSPAWGRKPRFEMPGNFEGPAGVSVFKTHYGGYAAVWHAWDRGAPFVPGAYGPNTIPGPEKDERVTHASSVVLPTPERPALVRLRTGPIEARKCRGRYATVDLSLGQSPTPGDDVIVGTGGSDVIDGLGGDDLICGWGGPDTLMGGMGDDIIYGGRGADTIDGNRGDDVIYGGAGSDKMNGGIGPDTCRGSLGRDIYYGCQISLSAIEAASASMTAGDEIPDREAGSGDAPAAEIDEGTAPTVVDASDTDAGAIDTDAGAIDTDAGAIDTDAGAIDTDAGAIDTDAGAIDTDAGAIDTDAGAIDTDAIDTDAGLGGSEAGDGPVADSGLAGGEERPVESEVRVPVDDDSGGVEPGSDAPGVAGADTTSTSGVPEPSPADEGSFETDAVGADPESVDVEPTQEDTGEIVSSEPAEVDAASQ